MSMLNRRLQILVDEDRYQALERTARARRVSVATVVRDAIDRDLAGPSMRRWEAGRRFLEAEPMPVGSVEELRAELDDLRGRHG
jgi:post-segregation antitoxin (ccd killing protein)